MTTNELTLHRFGQFMGMPVSLAISDPLPRSTLDRLVKEIFGWLRRVDALFSVYCADSQVSLLDHGRLRPGRADPLVREVLATCARLHRRTEGFFDVHATGRLDPSGYVKGWAIQRASALLTEAGATNHRLRVGGNVSISGRPGLDRTWQIRIRNPLQPKVAAWVVSATDMAVATTGGHLPGERIRNPLTRRPASGLASVTVAGPDLGIAGAYATAAVAMGLPALDWLPGLDGHAHVVIDDEGRCFHRGLPLPGQPTSA